MQCDRCEEWFHLLCVGLAEDEVNEEEEYECFNCKQGRGQKAVLVNPASQVTGVTGISSMYNGGRYGNEGGATHHMDKQDSDGIGNMLMCNEDVEVAMGTGGYGRSLLNGKGDTGGGMGALSKLTQFSYETDESSQDEVKSSYSLGGNSGDSQQDSMIAMATDSQAAVEGL